MPMNVTVRQQPVGLLITWSPPANSRVPVDYYVVEFRTVGRWVRLSGHVTDGTSYHWTTASRGATYHFRVKSYSASSQESNHSQVVSFNTGDPMLDGSMRVSNATVGGTIAGLLFVIIAVTATIFASKIILKKRKTNALQYENVKYFGPNHHETTSKSVNNTDTPAIELCDSKTTSILIDTSIISQTDDIDNCRDSCIDSSPDMIQTEVTV